MAEEKNKTAMQTFIDWYNDPEGFYMQSEVEDKMNELLLVEKQQISDAYTKGYANGMALSELGLITDTKYYNDTFS